jgi:hypothetical protein
VLIDNGSRWHMSKLKIRRQPADDEPIMVLVDDAEQVSDETPATLVDTAASAYSGCHGGQPDLHRPSTRQLGTKTAMYKNACKGRSVVVVDA